MSFYPVLNNFFILSHFYYLTVLSDTYESTVAWTII